MSDDIKRSDVLDLVADGSLVNTNPERARKHINAIPSADVVDRETGIKWGVELAAMHRSDATSKELDKAFFDGCEEGYKKAKEDLIKL